MLLTDLSTFILGKGIGTSIGTDIFIDDMPNTPNKLIMFAEYDNKTNLMDDRSGVRMVTTLVRDETSAGARALAYSIYSALQQDNNGGEAVYNLVAGKPAIVSLKKFPVKKYKDTEGRTLWGFDINIITMMS